MTKGNSVKKFLLTLKLAVIPAVVLVALLIGSVNPKPEPARAEPTGLVAMNTGLCITLGIAFGGLPATTAGTACLAMQLQAQMQNYVLCLRGSDTDLNGTHNCLDSGGLSNPERVTPADFATLDALDPGQFHTGQDMIVMLFVDDDFPVRFQTDFGNWTGFGQDIECRTGGEFNDPDCDEDPSTVGDGVVAFPLHVTEADGTGEAHVTVIQEGIGFPVTLTVVGVPQEITLEPLFGKDTIQTGATPATPFGQQVDATDCNFAASVEGVLGAVNSAEKTVIVAKALDNDGVEVAGALINWDWSKDYPDNTDFSAPTGTYAVHRLKQGGVALPQTPTIDTGTLGIAFPQFVCGGREPGDIELTASMSSVTVDPSADHATTKRITIHVVGPATDMALTADPPVIDCNGTNSSKITASLTNAAGDPVANGLDVNFEVLTLGTANPLKADSADGKASTVVTPLSGAGGVTADGQPKGVTVTVRANGQVHENSQIDEEFDPHELLQTPTETFEVVERSILVQCSGGPPPPGTGNAGAGAGGPATGTIRPPDTGTGGAAGGGGLPVWTLMALAGAAGTLATVSWKLGRSR